MAQEWELSGPRVLDVGGEGERVQRLTVEVAGGRLDVLTHNDSPAARIEVAELRGLPLQVQWDGSHLRVRQEPRGGFFERARAAFGSVEGNHVVLRISIPEDATVSARTVSASSLLTGLRAGAKADTVSGVMALDDIVGPAEVNTVSGDIEIQGVRGRLAVNSVSAAVTARDCELSEVKINTVSGDVAIDMTNAAATIGANSVSGDLAIRAPHSGYDIDANTATGQVVIDGWSVARGRRGQGGKLRGGDGGLRIKANAVSGNIVVLRPESSAAPAVAS